MKVDLLATVGDDWVGQAIIDYVRGFGAGLGDNIQVVPGGASPYTVVIEPQNHDRTLLTNTGVYNDYDLDNIDLDRVAAAKLFHLGYPTLLPRLYRDDGEGFLALLRAVKDKGVITSIDMSLPPPDSASGRADWQTILRRCLPYIDVFVPSIEEIMFMLRRRDLEQWGGKLLDRLTADYLAGLADELAFAGRRHRRLEIGRARLVLAGRD